MYMLIVSEILIFAGFFVAWFYLDATRGPFPGRLSRVDGLAGATMTGLLLLGSLTARYGRIAVVEEGDRSKLVLGYAMTVGIGVLFLAVLAFEWSNLLAEGLRWTTGPYGATYYALAGLHAGHLIAGLVLFGIVIYRARVRDHFSANRNLMVRTAEAYWHFLTAISIAIFIFIYFGTT